MIKKERIVLSAEQKESMIAAIKNYYLSERDEELGDLAAGLILNCISKELAPKFTIREFTMLTSL